MENNKTVEEQENAQKLEDSCESAKLMLDSRNLYLEKDAIKTCISEALANAVIMDDILHGIFNELKTQECLQAMLNNNLDMTQAVHFIEGSKYFTEKVGEFLIEYALFKIQLQASPKIIGIDKTITP